MAKYPRLRDEVERIVSEHIKIGEVKAKEHVSNIWPSVFDPMKQLLRVFLNVLWNEPFSPLIGEESFEISVFWAEKVWGET